MSSKPYTLKIEDIEKTFRGSLNLDWDVNTMATFNAVLKDAESLDGFDLITVERDDVEIFGGRIEVPNITFGVQGRNMPVSGFDHTIRLRDCRTPSQSIVDSATSAALTAILSDSDFNTSVGTGFKYVQDPTSFDTIIEFMDFVFSSTCIEVNVDTLEIEEELVKAGTLTGCASGLKSTFWYDGATERFYVWYKDGANNLFYAHSPDGDTWTEVDSTANPSGDTWSVSWFDSKVYLIYYDGANLDVWNGTITDATGAITWNNQWNNVIAGRNLSFGIVFDDQDDLWIITDLDRGYESTDDGQTWNNRFSAPANHELWGLAQIGSDGDMMCMAFDVPGTDLDEYLWDRSASTFTRVQEIDNAADIDFLDVAQDAAFNVYIVWADEDTQDVDHVTNQSGSWVDTSIKNANCQALVVTIGCDGYQGSYVGLGGDCGTIYYKLLNGTIIHSNDQTPFYGTSSYVNNPRTYLQDGQIITFFSVVDSGVDDVYFDLPDPYGIRLIRGASTGYFVTTVVPAGGSIVEWGLVTADGSGYDDSTMTDWQILKPDDTILLEDQNAPFDMEVAGLSSSEASIKVKVIISDSDAYISAVDISEKVDSVSLDTDYEDCYTGVQKLADLAGAEFWVTKDNSTYTVNFSLRRGIDKSNYVILKTASTSDEPDTNPNVKVLKKTFDWGSYANAVMVIGGDDGAGGRAEGEVRDNDEITRLGEEHWITIRDGDIVSDAMARTRATIELQRRNAVIIRISGEFVDKEASGQIEIGDSVTLISEWEDEDLKISGSNRIVKLHRSWGVGGETVKADFSNRLKVAQYYRYIKKTDDHDRWITA